jgi:hypothetical protein
MNDFDAADALGRLARAILALGPTGASPETLVELYETSLAALVRFRSELTNAQGRLAQIHERHIESAPGRRARIRVIQQQEILILELRKAMRHLLNDPSSDFAKRRAQRLLGPPG